MNLYVEAKRRFPDATDDELGDIIMCCTCYPFGTAEQINDNLDNIRAKASTPKHAINLAHEEMDRVWEETRAEREDLEKQEA